MIYQIFINTPLWVWALLFGLSFFGVWVGQAREVQLTRLMLIPFIMLFVSLMGLKSLYGFELKPLLYWLGGVGLALYLNRMVFKHPQGVVYKRESESYFVPQSYVPLVLIMSIFLVRYVVGVSTAMNLALTKEPSFISFISTVLGLCSGAFLARAFRIYHARHIK